MHTAYHAAHRTDQYEGISPLKKNIIYYKSFCEASAVEHQGTCSWKKDQPTEQLGELLVERT